MESRHTSKGGTPLQIYWCSQRTKKELRNRAASYISTNVAGLNVMMNTLGNQPEPLQKDTKNTWRCHHQYLNITMLLATQHQWKIIGRWDMIWPEPSKKPFTSELITLPLTRILANITCHIFGAVFCFLSQNWKLNEHLCTLTSLPQDVIHSICARQKYLHYNIKAYRRLSIIKQKHLCPKYMNKIK